SFLTGYSPPQTLHFALAIMVSLPRLKVPPRQPGKTGRDPLKRRRSDGQLQNGERLLVSDSEAPTSTHLQKRLVRQEQRVLTRNLALRAGAVAHSQEVGVADNQKRVAVRALHRGGRGLGTQRPGDRDVEQGVRGTPVSALTTDEDGHALKVLDATQLLPESRVSDDNGLLQVEVVPDLVQTQNLGSVVVGDARRSGRGVVVVRRVVGVHVALAKSRVDGDEGDGGAVRDGRGHTQGGVVEELPVGGRPVNALLVKDVDVGVNQVLLRDLHGAPELPGNQKNLVVQ